MIKRPLFIISLPVRPLTVGGGALLLILVLTMLVVRGAEVSLDGYTIVVDAGHGGDDRGVCYFPRDLIEKEINLDMTDRVKDGLERAGARVILTRTDDTFIPLERRAEIANQAEADLLLSIHTNRIPGHPECFGAQTFYFPESEAGKRLALTMQEELIKVDPANYRVALPGSYKVLRLSKMPGALVEIGFLTNERDRGLIGTEAYRRRIVEAIVAGVVRYVLERSPKGSPPFKEMWSRRWAGKLTIREADRAASTKTAPVAQLICE